MSFSPADRSIFDRDVRLHIYGHLLDAGVPPSPATTAEAVGATEEQVRASYGRLADGHVIVLRPGSTDEIWMANPLSAVPTGFTVRVSERSWFRNCISDGLGILAILDSDGTVQTTCPDCDVPMSLTVEGARLKGSQGVAHFAVPAAHWWDDIGYA